MAEVRCLAHVLQGSDDTGHARSRSVPDAPILSLSWRLKLTADQQQSARPVHRTLEEARGHHRLAASRRPLTRSRNGVISIPASPPPVPSREPFLLFHDENVAGAIDDDDVGLAPDVRLPDSRVQWTEWKTVRSGSRSRRRRSNVTSSGAWPPASASRSTSDGTMRAIVSRGS